MAVEDGSLRTVSLLAGPIFTVIEGLVLAVLLASEMSVAVKVCVPTVLSVTLAVRVPADKEPFTGNIALESLEVIPTV